MRPARCSAVVMLVLAATSMAFAKDTTTVFPRSAGTVTHFPILGGTYRTTAEALQVTCFVTTPKNLEWRRGFLEFPLPYGGKREVTKATLFITEIGGEYIGQRVPPVTHELSSYSADLVVDASDYAAPTTLVGTFETENERGLYLFEFDVTDSVRQAVGGVGFRIKLQIDPAGPCTNFESALFGTSPSYLPRLVIETRRKNGRAR